MSAFTATLASLGPFLLITLVLVGIFSATLYWAGGAGRDGAAPRGQALCLMLAVPLAVGLLYAVRGEPSALVLAAQTERDGQAAPHAEADMLRSVQKLSERLQSKPEDVDGWLMLARSYNTLERYADAAAAYEHAQARAWQDPALLTEWIETRLFAADRQFDARTHELVDRANALAPKDPDVLLFYSLSTFARGDKAAAAQAMRTLREHYPAGSPDRDAIEAALDQITQGKDPRETPPPAAPSGR